MVDKNPAAFFVPEEYCVSRESLEKLKLYHALLLKWQKAINLVSSNTLKEAWGRHFLDSLQLLPFVESCGKLVDLGSGAGFPGMVLSIVRPELRVTIVDSDERKCQFVKSVSRETLTPIDVFNGRVEILPSDLMPDIVTARGFAPLEDILDLTQPLYEGNSNLRYVLLKGRNANEEIAQAAQFYDFSLQKHASIVEADSSVLVISDVRKR
jgi:16S rRNA (guanine527-N7)-methyltransferase